MDITTSNNCNFCKIKNAKPTTIFTDKEITILLERIYSGSVNTYLLDVNTYQRIARHLTKGVYEGFGKSIINVQWGTPDFDMLTSLKDNTYIFSAAKTYQQTKDISSLLVKDGKVQSFREFKKEAKPIFNKYNRDYLEVEYQSAIMQARTASKWIDIERTKDVYEKLEYHTAGDSRVRRNHEVLNGIIRPVDDKFWSTFMPPNGWNCRCTVLQTTGVESTVLNKSNKPSKDDVPDIFRFNAGKDKIIFSKKHPYFDVPKDDKDFAKRNFNLPL